MTEMVMNGANSTAAPETEIVIYARIGEPDGLKAADSIEEQEQVELKIEGMGKIRVRKTTSGGVTSYEQTVKRDIKDKVGGLDSQLENNIPIDAAFYEAFKSLGKTMMKKTRYIFKSKNVTMGITADGKIGTSVQLPEVLYEVDVFRIDSGNICAWCKIDIEVDRLETFITQNYPDLKNIKMNIKVSHLPFKPEQCFIDTGKLEPDMVEFLDELWTKYFRQPIQAIETKNDMAIGR